jgi:MinD-like ATPase involved in chromosome partitioning or flagellar assembly
VLIVVAAAKGSPGVTATARVLASVWPQDVVLADCDPAGGDIAIVGRGPGGTVLDPDRGMLSLAAGARRGLAAGAFPDHLQVLDGGLRVLVGATNPDQATGIGPAWPAVAQVLAAQGRTDVIVDCGRVTPGTLVSPVLAAAHAVVLIARPRLESYAHLRERVRWLVTMHNGSRPGPAVGVVLVTDAHDTKGPRELGQLLAHERLDVPVLGRLADDKRAAEALAGRMDRGIGRSLLVRSARVLVDPIRQLAADRELAQLRF